MNILTFIASCVVIVRLVTYESTILEHYKPRVNFSAYGITLIMCHQAICILIDGHNVVVSQFIVTTALAAGAVFYKGNVSHLVRGVTSLFRRIM